MGAVLVVSGCADNTGAPRAWRPMLVSAGIACARGCVLATRNSDRQPPTSRTTEGSRHLSLGFAGLSPVVSVNRWRTRLHLGGGEIVEAIVAGIPARQIGSTQEQGAADTDAS